MTARRSLAGTSRFGASDDSPQGLEERPVLAVDCSGPWCAAAVLSSDKVILREEPMDKGQAERLLPLLEEMLAECGLIWSDLRGIAVGTGPGNFTGVRIAVAAARGLALGLGIPAVGVTRLEALAHGLPRPLTVIEDARRGEAYVQLFTASGDGPAHLATRAVAATAVTGSAAGAAALAPAMPMIEATARLGAARISAAATGAPLPRPAPFYLRGADAAPPSDPPPVILDA